MTIRIRAPLSRRRFLVSSAAAVAAGGVARPYISRAADRPAVSHGVQSGDVLVDSGVVWVRADRPSRLLVDWATTESFKDAHRAAYLDVLKSAQITRIDRQDAKAVRVVFEVTSEFLNVATLPRPAAPQTNAPLAAPTPPADKPGKHSARKK